MPYQRHAPRGNQTFLTSEKVLFDAVAPGNPKLRLATTLCLLARESRI